MDKVKKRKIKWKRHWRESEKEWRRNTNGREILQRKYTWNSSIKISFSFNLMSLIKRNVSWWEFSWIMMTIYLSNKSYCSLVLIRQLYTAWLFVFIFISLSPIIFGRNFDAARKVAGVENKNRTRENNKSITRFWYDDKTHKRQILTK